MMHSRDVVRVSRRQKRLAETLVFLRESESSAITARRLRRNVRFGSLADVGPPFCRGGKTGQAQSACFMRAACSAPL
jgi:hypothetical protein